MAQRHGARRFTGCDVDAEAVAWCSANLEGGPFFVNSPEPPLPCEPEQFDLVYAISVFTHLDEPAQQDWLAELRRVLKPGGIALVTLHGARTWAGSPVETEVRGHGFLFSRTEKLKGFCPDWYQTSSQTEEYTRAEFRRCFDVLAYLPEAFGLQDAAILERRGGDVPLAGSP